MTRPNSRRHALLLVGGALVGLSLLALLFIPSRAVPAYAQGTCGDTVTVVAGDTLTRIAARCGTTVQAILTANPQITNPNLIYVGQVIEMPGAQGATPTATTQATPTPTSTPTGTTTTYVVQPGDTLTRIAQRFGTTVQAILAANPQITNPNLIYVGQVIEIPGGQAVTPTPTPTTTPVTPTPTPTPTTTTPTPTPTPTSTPSGTTTTYVVQPGDTLTRIAQRFGTTVQALLAANPQITNPNLIYAGQVIEIPGGQAVTPTPTPSGTPTPQRISFATGATEATVSGNLPANGDVRYVLHAEAGQLLEVDVTAAHPVHLTIYGKNGIVIFDQPDGSPFFRGTLPDTEDYQLVIEADTQATSYSMAVVLPARISFATGTTSATVSGNLPASGVVDYILHAEAGQLLEAGVTAPHAVHLTIVGADGVVVFDQPDGSSFFRGTLPESEDYQLILEADTQATTYSMAVTIPQRVSFASGTTSATEQGQLGAQQQHAYVLQAQAGQQMKVTVTASAGAVSLTIYGVDGTVLKNQMSEGTTFDGTLPLTEDYIITITAGGAAASYTLVVEIT
ncbi:MAG: LysM peptidoglycan-binding domain-containing protein [Anaerolineae bacterium]